MKYILIINIETEEASLEDIEKLVKTRLEEDEYDWLKLSVKSIEVLERTENTRFIYYTYE